MGLKNLAKSLFSGTDNRAVVKESLRLAEAAGRLLKSGPDWKGGEEAGRELAKLTKELAQAAANADGRLIMGLLGGTGVGKSTLISALAGEPISASSVIRPTTSLPVIYRHESFPLPSHWPGLEAVHKVEALRGLAIIDFPDFDSLETAHHQQVDNNLAGLDLVVWVTDYHKYADRRMYEVMHKAGATLGGFSQVALLNKVDELAARDDGSEAVSYILESFGRQLKEFAGWNGPPPWPVAAAESLANPGDREAGGLAPLRALLDELADEKYRRAVQSGNLETRNSELIKNFAAQAEPQKWLEQLTRLEHLADQRPEAAIEADLAALTLMRPAYIAPRLDALRKRTRGLLGTFTDAWDFVATRFKPGPDLPPPAPAPQSPVFVSQLLGQAEDFNAVTGTSLNLKRENLQKEAAGILESSLSGSFRDPRVGSALLYLWPLALAFLLIWAETGGQYGGPAALTAAALRSAAPWLIFGLIGDFIISRFIWFRARRRYEADFHKGLYEARGKLSKMAETNLIQPVRQTVERLTLRLDLLAELERKPQ